MLKKLISIIFPVNKSYNELEEPIKRVLSTKAVFGGFAVIGMISLLFVKFDWHLKLLGEVMLLAYIGTIVHFWWLFITDSVCSLEAVYQGRSEIDEINNPALRSTSKIRHRFVSRKIYLVKDSQKYEVVVNAYDDSVSKGDIIKVYTTPSNVNMKQNGIVKINSSLAWFVVSTDEPEVETEETEEE